MVEVFGIQLTDKEDFLARKDEWYNLLDELKSKKISRLVSTVDVQRSLLGEIIIRSILCQRLKLKNKDLVFDYNNNNKPCLRGGKIHFNISHSGEWVVCAISEKDVGIDIEKIRKLKLNIAERYFSGGEIADLKKLDGSVKHDYFFTLWTIKESYLKLLGRGLTKALNTFTVRKSGNEFQIFADQEVVPDVFVRQYEIMEGYKLAVVARENQFSQIVTIRKVDEYLDHIK